MKKRSSHPVEGVNGEIDDLATFESCLIQVLDELFDDRRNPPLPSSGFVLVKADDLIAGVQKMLQPPFVTGIPALSVLY